MFVSLFEFFLTAQINTTPPKFASYVCVTNYKNQALNFNDLCGLPPFGNTKGILPYSPTLNQILPFVLSTPFTRGSRETASCSAFAKALKIASIW